MLQRNKLSKSKEQDTVRKLEGIAKLEAAREISCHPAGLFIDQQLPFLGGKPDSITEDGCIVVVKSLNKNWDLPIASIDTQQLDHVAFLNGAFEIKKNHDTHYEIQGLLKHCDAQTCIFVLQTGVDCIIIDVERDLNFFYSKIEDNISEFFQYFSIEVVDSRLARSMPLREFDKFATLIGSLDWQTGESKS